MLQSRHEIPSFGKQIDRDASDNVTYFLDPTLIKENNGNSGSSLLEGIADAKNDDELFYIVEGLRYRPTDAEWATINTTLKKSAEKSLQRDFSFLTEKELLALVQRLLQVLDFISDGKRLDLRETDVVLARLLPPDEIKSGDKDKFSDRYFVCGPTRFGSSNGGFRLSIWRKPNDESGKVRYQAEIMIAFNSA